MFVRERQEVQALLRSDPLNRAPTLRANPARPGRATRVSSATLATRQRYPTSTLAADGRIVPWLAADGPLSYSPEHPPERDYWFQYGWVLPGVLSQTVNPRRHYYFGAYRRDDAREVFAFWNAVRGGRATRIEHRFGVANPTSGALEAPMAVYAISNRRGRREYCLIQHGSYQSVPAEEQPHLESGELLVHRGVQRAATFRFPRFGRRRSGSEQNVWTAFVTLQARMLSDSLLSFNTIHDRAKRCETGHIRDGTWVSDELALAEGLDIGEDGAAEALWHATHQSFTLCRSLAEYKFGPSYVTCKTSIDNVRITTFFAREHEVRILDPDRLQVLEARRCTVDRS